MRATYLENLSYADLVELGFQEAEDVKYGVFGAIDRLDETVAELRRRADL